MCCIGEVDPKERLARQRKLLQKKLGLDMGAAIGMDTDELFNDDDLDYTCSSHLNRAHAGKGLTFHTSRTHTVRPSHQTVLVGLFFPLIDCTSDFF